MEGRLSREGTRCKNSSIFPERKNKEVMEERTAELIVTVDNDAPKSYKLLLGSEVFSFIKNKPKHTYEGKNGFKIICNPKKNPSFTGTKLILDQSGPIGLFRVHMSRKSVPNVDYCEFVAKLPRIKTSMEEALDEYRRSASPDVGREQSFRFLDIDNSLCFDITISEDVYDALKKRVRDISFAGITLAAKDDYNPGFGNGNKNTLFINEEFRGKKVRIEHDFVGYGKLVKKKNEIMQFFKELNGWLEITVDILEPSRAETQPTERELLELISRMLQKT